MPSRGVQESSIHYVVPPVLKTMALKIQAYLEVHLSSGKGRFVYLDSSLPIYMRY